MSWVWAWLSGQPVKPKALVEAEALFNEEELANLRARFTRALAEVYGERSAMHRNVSAQRAARLGQASLPASPRRICC